MRKMRCAKYLAQSTSRKILWSKYYLQSTLLKVLSQKYFAQSTFRNVLSAKYFAQSTFRNLPCAMYSPKVLITRFEDLPAKNTFPSFEIFPIAWLSQFPGFSDFSGSMFPVVSRFVASGKRVAVILLMLLILLHGRPD